MYLLRQVQQECLTKEHVESFKQQMVDMIRCAKENPDIVKQLGGAEDDDSGLIAGSLSDVVDSDGATRMSVSVDVTRVGGTQPIPITVLVAPANDGASHHLDNPSLTVGGRQLLTLTPSSDARKPGGSSSTEMSSDAEFYTPVGSPDESHQLSAEDTLIHLDELSAASALSAAVVSKVGNSLVLSNACRV